MAINSLGRELPAEISGRMLVPYRGPFSAEPLAVVGTNKRQKTVRPGETKLLRSIREAILKSGLRNGMTISFHHHFREGDRIVGRVLSEIRALGIKNLTFAPSAVVSLREPPLSDFVRDGTIRRIEASGIRGELGDAVLEGLMDEPVILRPHGGRPRAIEAGELNIDVAFLGAPAADEYGNAAGCIGPNACGSLGFAMIDARSAATVVVLTDHLVAYPCVPASILQDQVDFVVLTDEIGDPEQIGRGAARVTRNPRDLLIAKRAASVMANCGWFRDGFTFLTGVGAVPIACIGFLRDEMTKRGVTAGMMLGGIPGAAVRLAEDGLVQCIQAVQNFDAESALAVGGSPKIFECDNSLYANPHTRGCLVNRLDIALLGALEVDTNFNVNLLTGSNGRMLGGLGGGPDAAAGAAVSIVVLPLVRGRIPSVVRRVLTVCTPGETVAAVVTEAGIALNPRHRSFGQIRDSLAAARIRTVSIEELRQMAEEITGVPKPVEMTGRITAVVEYRDGTVLDIIRQIKPD